MVGNAVRIVKKEKLISRYDVMKAFFQTEKENNEEMANQLNEMLNDFCRLERKYKRNIVSLPFDAIAYKVVIDYIKKSL